MSYLPNPGADFEQTPAGTHLASCYRVIDLGTQDVVFEGKQKRTHQVRVTWELPDELMKDGRPFSISKTYTWSMSTKSSLRKHLEAWRGRPFGPDDFGPPNGFNIKNVLGKSCLVTVKQTVKTDGDVISSVDNVTNLMKGQKAKPPLNTCIYLWLDHNLFDKTVFEMLHEKTRETIAKSPEYDAIVSGRPLPQHDERNPPSRTTAEDMSDSVPF